LTKPESRLGSALYGFVALPVFGLLLAVATLLVLVVPGLAVRRWLVRKFARLGLAVLGLHVTVRGAHNLPPGSCVVVANHASYLDGVVLKAVLPPRFTFVIKREAARLPVAGLLLRRIGAEFVDRASYGGRQTDARRVVRRAEAGHALAFFPEGTFKREPGLRRFHVGAFVAAVRAQQPLVPIVIRGARRSMPSGRAVPRAGRIEVEILEPLRPSSSRDAAEQLRREARRQIASRLDEPDLESSGVIPVRQATEA